MRIDETSPASNARPTRRITTHGITSSSSGSRSPMRADAPDGSQIAERTICIVVDIKRVGNRKKVSNGEIEVDADRESISVSKVLLEHRSWLNIVNHDTRIRRYLGSRCLPSMLRGGVFLLPLTLIEEVDARLEEMAAERERLVGEFLLVYPDLVEAARARLRGLFDPADYPEPRVVRNAFSFTWRMVGLEVPKTLAVINREVFVREREKQARAWDEAAQAIQTLLRANMAELVGHMTDRLSPGQDGRPKAFKNSLVTNLSEFLRHFEARNVTDDRDLAALVQRAQQLLEGVDPDVLRRSQDLRQNVQSGFSEIRQSLDGMVGNRPTRRIVLDRSMAGVNNAPETVARLTVSAS